MAGKGFEINHRGIEQITSELERAFAKHPIRIPLEADATGLVSEGGLGLGNVTNHYYGPTVHVVGDRAQIAWGPSSAQNQDGTQAVASGYEDLAATVAEVRRRLADAGLTPEDQREAEATTDELLRELTLPVPDEAQVRRGARLLTGFLAPILLHVGEAVATDWITDAIERLQHIHS